MPISSWVSSYGTPPNPATNAETRQHRELVRGHEDDAWRDELYGPAAGEGAVGSLTGHACDVGVSGPVRDSAAN